MTTDTSVDIQPDHSSVVAGFFLGLLLQLIPGGFIVVRTPLLLFVGVTQLVYIVPAVIIARSKGRRRLAKGLIIAASLVALLNAACWGVVVGGGLFQF